MPRSPPPKPKGGMMQDDDAFDMVRGNWDALRGRYSEAQLEGWRKRIGTPPPITTPKPHAGEAAMTKPAALETPLRFDVVTEGAEIRSAPNGRWVDFSNYVSIATQLSQSQLAQRQWEVKALNAEQAVNQSQARIVELEKDNKLWHANWEAAYAEKQAAEKDAERYRWLREAHLPPTTVLTVVTNKGYGLWAKALDDAIDAAMKERP